MGYFKRLTSSSFKIDHVGNTIFFPWGVLGKGYIVPDKITEDKIRNFVTLYHVVGLTLIFVVGVFLMLWDIAFVIIIPAAVLVWYLQTIKYVKGLKQSEERLSLKDNLKRMFINGSS